MGNNTHTIEINAVLKTTLGNVDSTIKELQNKLRSGDLQIDLTKGVGKDLSKLVSNFETSFSKINQMTPDNLLNILDSKEFQKEGTSIIKTIQEIQRIVNDVGTKSMIDAKKLFPNAFDGRVTELQGLIQNVSTSLESLTKKEATFNKLNTEIAGLTAKIQELDEAAANQGKLEEEWNRATKAVEATNTAVNNLRENLRGQLELKIQQNSVDKTEQKIEELNKELEEFANKGVTAGKGGRGIFQGKGIGDWEKIAKNGTTEEKNQAQAALELLRNYNSVNSALKEQKTLLEDVKKAQELLNQSPQLSDNKSLKEAGSILGQKEEVTNALEQQTNATNRATQAQLKLAQAENASAQKQELQQQINQKTQRLNELDAAIKNLRTNTDLGTLTQKFNELTGLNLAPTKENLQIMLEKLREIDNTSYENLKASLQKLGVVLPETKQDVDNLRNSFRQGETDVKNFNNRLNEVEQLKTRMAYFFGLTNSIQLFRRAVTQALNTIKELDKTMTEAAVVTEFDIGDMWEKLPQYSSNAQKLGVSINGMYQATTLYYQQGLKTNEAMALGTETMKMAKIAGMESAEATEAMTAALRGFNMELNETSATRVNDVYSQLAAVTAADTEQIATAMSKTASIAASANMEFETTAALLAQIIETTQEAPETAGTAMKTIIARFSEVKSLREQGLTSGKDEEGEAIDVNKIQAALRTVGISMEGFFAGTEGLDSILLKLAEKWEHLDFETQRYVATMAAGSRQQSRFIAMMSDYGRTVELVGEAQNSAGASQRQFEKTQESLETALARLSNAWNQFLMGLANNEVLKTAINSLTTLIETLNKFLTFVSGGSGGLKSVVSLLTTIATLKMGRGLLGTLGKGGLVGQLFGGKNVKQQGAKSAKSFSDGFKSGLKGLFTTKTMNEENLDLVKGNVLGVYKNLDEDTKAAINNAKSYEDLTNVTEQYNKTAGKTKGTVIDLNKSVDDTGAKFEKNQVSLQKTQATLSGVATASMAAGMAVGLLGGLFESLGWEDQAKAAEYLSYGLTAVGLAFTLASAAANLFKISALKALGVAAIIGAAIMAVILIISVFVSSSNEFEKEAENAATAAEVAANAAKEAKQAYDELLSGHQDYDELQKGLEDLVQGTNEWRDALLAANDQVLELLKTYPELYQYLGTGKYGQLTITEEGWQEAERLALEKREKTSASLAAANLRETQANFAKVQQEMYNELGMTVEEFHALVEQVSQGNTDSLEVIDDEKLQKKVIEYVQFAQKTKAQMDAQGKALLSSSASDELLGYDFSQALFSGASSNYNTYKGITGTDWHLALGGQTAEQKELLDHYGIMEKELADLGGLERAQYIYKKVMNVDEIDEKIAKDGDELLKAVAQVYATEQSQGILEELAKNLSKKDKATQGKLTTMLSGDTGFASLASQQGFLDLDFDEFLSDIGMDKDQLADYWGVDVENLVSTFQGRKLEIYDAYEDVFSDPDLYGMGVLLETQITEFNNALMHQGHETGLNLGQTEALAQSMAKVAVNGGDTTALFEQLNAILGGLSGPDLEEAVSILSNVDDWTSKDDIDRAIDSLRGFGIAVENDVVKELYKAAKAMRAFNAATVEAKLGKLAEVDDILSEKAEEGSSTYTAEQMEKLIEQGLGVDQFVKVGQDEYVLLEPIDNLRKALEENTSAVLEESITDAKESLKIAKNYEDAFKITETFNVQGKDVTIQDIVTSIANGTSSVGVFDDDILSKVAALLGLDVSGLNKEQIFGAIKENYSHYENRIATQGSLNQLETDAATMSTYSKIGSFDFNEEEEGASAALDAYIQQENLAFAVDKAAEALGVETEKLKENRAAFQSLVARNHKTIKSIKQLTDTINDQSEALQIANLNRLEYQQALTKVADQASEVFGVEVDEEFVHQYRDLFTQWAEGGPGAQVAYEELGKKAAESYMKGLGNIDIQAVMNAIEAGIDPSIEVGIAFDATDLFNTLEEKLGSIEAAAKVLQARGYSVSFETKWQVDGQPGFYDTKEAAIEANGGATDVIPTPVRFVNGIKTDPGGGYKGGSGGSSNNYENGYDRLHNILQEINDTLRERERLERQYQRLLNQNLATAEELSEISQQNIAGYQFEISKQNDIIAGRLAQIEGEKLGNPDLQNLIYTETGRDGEQSIRINWEGLQAIKNADAGERADEYYDRIQGWLESIYEAQTAIEEAQDAIYEEMLQGRDEYLELEEQVKEAIINERQKEIDKLSAINDSINDTNSKLLESMQQQLDEYRQNRENEKTEDEIADKQRRLAYLQQDTSGANAKEILDLQKEIDESQESYTDQLIDQKISELQQQNDKAAEQRQQQIDIMQAQLDKYSESSEIWEDVAELVAEGTNATEGLISGSELETLLKSSEAFAGMSKIQKMDWLNQINNQLAAALKWMSDGAVASMNVGKTITFTAKGNSTPITGTVNEQGQVITEDGAVFNKVSMDAYGNYSTSETMSEAINNQEAEQESKINQEEIAMFPYGKPTQISAQPTYGESSGLIKALQHALNAVGNYNLTVDGVWGNKTLNAVNAFRGANGLWNTPWEDTMRALEDKVKEALKGKINLSQYKTGGLADFTGPAWLDGTKSRPEYILNADQTKAFFNLVDVLGSLQTSSFKTAQNSGDNTYDIDINVESIGSDYDVEQLATAVKRLINEDARYRNNNTINLTR